MHRILFYNERNFKTITNKKGKLPADEVNALCPPRWFYTRTDDGTLLRRIAIIHNMSVWAFRAFFYFFLLRRRCNISHTYCIIYLANVCTGTAGLSRWVHVEEQHVKSYSTSHTHGAPTESRRRDLWMHCWHFLMAKIFSHFPGVIPPQWRPLDLYFIYIFWVFFLYIYLCPTAAKNRVLVTVKK